MMILANECKADGVKDYIEWALSKDYAVIDVNVPKYVTRASVGFSLMTPVWLLMG
jgi:hypothetical protein